MTSYQTSTINSIKSQIKKVSPWVTEEKTYTNMYGYPQNWIGFVLSDYDGHQYANVVINGTGKIVRGKYNRHKPIYK